MSHRDAPLRGIAAGEPHPLARFAGSSLFGAAGGTTLRDTPIAVLIERVATRFYETEDHVEIGQIIANEAASVSAKFLEGL